MFPPLEDDARDILSKAARGLDIEADSLAQTIGLALPTVLAAMGKNAFPAPAEIPDAAWLVLAAQLNLHPDALLAIARNRYRPGLTAPPWLVQITTRHKSMEVNAWILANPANNQAIIIDTGGDARPLIRHIAQNRWSPTHLLLTHDHPDHIAGLSDISAAFPDIALLSPELDHVPGTTALRPGTSLTAAGFAIDILPTPGHTDGGLSYSIAGTTPPVCFVGDALFAGSIGGARFSYPDALSTLREHIFTLREETLLCTGHGPLTSVALEAANNPFIAKAP